MSDLYSGSRVISGNYGEVWIYDEYYGEVTSANAKITTERQDIAIVRKLGKGSKITGWSGTGEVKGNKVRSFWQQKLLENMKAGKDTICDIVLKLDDPDAFGKEKVTLKNCTFDELVLMDFENGKQGEESMPFKFTDVVWPEADMISHEFTAPE